jgi:hypothetical protein
MDRRVPTVSKEEILLVSHQLIFRYQPDISRCGQRVRFASLGSGPAGGGWSADCAWPADGGTVDDPGVAP